MIERINSYEDDRFEKHILLQHGAFLVDGIPCSFEITSTDSAIVSAEKDIPLDEVIIDFRYYAEHITKFYDTKHNLVKEFPSIELIDVEITDIMPSQFYVNHNKLEAISSFIKTGDDVVVPLSLYSGRYLLHDGHSRLFCANAQGIKKVKGFIIKNNPLLLAFAEEGKNRNIHHIRNLEAVSNEEYEVKWNQFCNEFISKLDSDNSSQI